MLYIPRQYLLTWRRQAKTQQYCPFPTYLSDGAARKADVSEGLSLLAGFMLISEWANRIRSGSLSTALTGVGLHMLSRECRNGSLYMKVFFCSSVLLQETEPTQQNAPVNGLPQYGIETAF